jgi:hypothetical protein
MAEHQVVLGIFANEAAADAAVESLKSWDQVTDEIKLSAIGVLVTDEHGDLKQQKLGARSGKKGAGIGLVLAVIAPPTLLAGMVGGGVLGHFHHKGLGLRFEDEEWISAEIVGGKAAVGVLATDAEAGAIAGKLAELGGAVELFEVTEEALEAVATAAQVEPDAAPAAPEAPTASA